MELLTNVLLDIWDVLSSYCLTALLFSAFFTVVYVLLGYESRKSFFKQLADTVIKDREFQRFFVVFCLQMRFCVKKRTIPQISCKKKLI